MFGLKERVETAAQNAAFLTVGGILCAVGLGFFTAAAWILLAVQFDAVVASMLMGFVYCCAGLVVLNRGEKRGPSKRKTTEQPQPPLTPLQQVAVSFVQGVESGMASKNPPKDS